MSDVPQSGSCSVGAGRRLLQFPKGGSLWRLLENNHHVCPQLSWLQDICIGRHSPTPLCHLSAEKFCQVFLASWFMLAPFGWVTTQTLGCFHSLLEHVVSRKCGPLSQSWAWAIPLSLVLTPEATSTLQTAGCSLEVGGDYLASGLPCTWAFALMLFTRHCSYPLSSSKAAPRSPPLPVFSVRGREAFQHCIKLGNVN